MSSRRKTTKTRPAPESTVAAGDDVNEFDEEAADDLESLLGGQTDNAIAMVYKIGKPGEKDGYLETLTFSQIVNPGPEPVLRDTFGPGSYRLRFKVPNARGVLKFAGNKVYAIADRSQAANGQGTNGHNSGPWSREDYLRDELRRNHDLLIAAMGANKGQSMDLTGLAALLTAVNGGKRDSDLAQVVSAFTSLKRESEPTNPVDQLTKTIELARVITGNGAPALPAGDEPDSGWGGILKNLAAGFMSGMAGNRGGPQRALPPGEPEADNDEDEQEMLKWLTAQIGFLKVKAQRNAPVENWIRYTLDNQDEPGSQAVLTAIRAGGTFENLLQFDPEIANTPQLRLWFQKFYDGIRNPINPAPAIPWFARDTTNTASNETPGAQGQSAAPGSNDSGDTPKTVIG